MIGAFETMARRHPDKTCFTYVGQDGAEAHFSYRQLRMTAASLAQVLQRSGVRRGSCVVVDLPNVPEYPLLILAAAYGGFTLVALNHRLTAAEKLTRTLELDLCRDAHVAFRVDEGSMAGLLQQAKALVKGGQLSRGRADAQGRGARGSARAAGAQPEARRRRQMYPHDAEESVIHFAEHAGHVFDPSARALIMFTSGTTGKSKAVPLTWNNIIGSAEIANAALSGGKAVWQAALPLYHIGGFQVVLRSLCAATPFVLYGSFDAQRMLADVRRFGVTHASVVDKMLQDLLSADDGETLAQYACLLLGGGALNPKTLERAAAAGARVFASYGMTETSSLIAATQVTGAQAGAAQSAGLRLLPGYDARIVDAGADGFGRLAVKGPGVLAGYLNARVARTVDGFFLTGDTAALHGGRLFVKERMGDMFVSGGENVYPAEIVDKLLRVPGVADAHVFGVPDATWGRRPVAFVERERGGRRGGAGDAAAAAAAAATLRASAGLAAATGGRSPWGEPSGQASEPSPQQFAEQVKRSLAPSLSKLYLPKHVCVVDRLPRSGIGKLDRAAIEALYDQRIEVASVTLYHVKLPFTRPFKTAKETLRERESLIVQVMDHAGRTGLGECVAFPTDWYLSETLPQDAQVLQQVLVPKVLKQVYLHPSEASAAFAADEVAAAFPLACGALEPALWDLYGKIVGKPLWQLIGEAGGAAEAQREPSANVAAGAVVGMESVEETLAAVRQCVGAGYRRVKMKVAPGGAAERVRAVRREFPQLALTLDANQSFTEAQAGELRELDGLGVLWIEEPLDPARPSHAGSQDLFARLARLQRSMRTPICLDESFENVGELRRALAHPELRCVAVKIGKFGGVQPALDFVRFAMAHGIQVWMGGMYDTGISKRLHAAFQTLSGVDVPGDIGSVTRYFAADVVAPPHLAAYGWVTLNRGDCAHGLGCELDEAALKNVLVNSVTLHR